MPTSPIRSYPLEEIDKIMRALDAGADLPIANRDLAAVALAYEPRILQLPLHSPSTEPCVQPPGEMLVGA